MRGGVVSHYLAGERLRSLAIWLDEEAFALFTGWRWRIPTVPAVATVGVCRRVAGTSGK